MNYREDFLARRRSLSRNGGFDGANDTGTRSSVSYFPLDSRRELTPAQREVLVKKSRLLRNNLGLVRRMIDGTTRMAIGTGLIPSAATKDPVFNAAADEYFDRWATSSCCDVSGQHNFYGLQKLACQEMMCDGECFAIQTKSQDGFCQLQMLKTHQVGDVSHARRQDAWLDGLRVNAVGRTIGYRILQDATPGIQPTRHNVVPRDYDATDVVHIFDPERIGQRRGLPWIYHGENSCIDILDLIALEKAAVKLHSYFAAAITTPSGDAPKGLGGRIPGNSKSATNAKGDETRQYQEFIGGAAIPVLKNGEKFDFYTSNRPATTFAGFIDFLVRDVAWGFGVSPEFIWSVAGLGGANTRYILADAGWFFEEVQQLMVDRFCQRIYNWVLANGILRGELQLGSDLAWWLCNWQGPQKITVDKTRDGNLEINLMKNGMLTMEEYWSSRGKDAAKMRRKRIDELAEDIAYCQAKSVPIGLYMQTLPGQGGLDLQTTTDIASAIADALPGIGG